MTPITSAFRLEYALSPEVTSHISCVQTLVKARGKKSNKVFRLPKWLLSFTSTSPEACLDFRLKSGALVPTDNAISLFSSLDFQFFANAFGYTFLPERLSNDDYTLKAPVIRSLAVAPRSAYLSLLALAKRPQVPGAANDKHALNDRRRCHYGFIQIASADDFQGVGRFDDGHLSAIRGRVDSSAGRDRRSVVAAGSVQPFLKQRLAGPGVAAGEDAAVLHIVQPVPVKQRRRHLGNSFQLGPGHVRRGRVLFATQAHRQRAGLHKIPFHELGHSFEHFYPVGAVKGSDFIVGTEQQGPTQRHVARAFRSFPVREQQTFGQLISADFPILVGVVFGQQFIERRRQVDVLPLTENPCAGEKEEAVGRYGCRANLIRQSGNPPALVSGLQVMGREPARVQNTDQIVRTFAPDQGCGPSAVELRLGRFPKRLAVFAADGQQMRLLIQMHVHDEPVVGENGRSPAAKTHKGLGDRQRLLPEDRALEIIRQQTIRTEIHE